MKQSTAARRSWRTGFTHFESVNKPEWGFGTYPDVVITTQVEQMFSTGRTPIAPASPPAPAKHPSKCPPGQRWVGGDTAVLAQALAAQ